jgi:hypothetical protein
MLRNVLHLFTFCCIVIIGLSQAKTGQAISFDKLGTEATRQLGGKGLSVTELWNGYKLESRLQDLQAEVTMSGVKIISTSKSEGIGSFTIKPSKLGRKTCMNELGTVADWMKKTEGMVKISRNDMVEEYSTSGDGIRQDFVISSKPEGQGKLLLNLVIDGAKVTSKSQKDRIEIRLSCGRMLSYHALRVTDANGYVISSNFTTVKGNIIITPATKGV